MAIVKGPITLTGSISNISFYTRKGSDKVIARTKGGARKEKIKSSAKFEGFRLQQNEWKGCTRFASIVRYAFGGLHRVADYNLTPVLNAFAKNLQKTDTEGINGQRGIYLSAYRYTLDGFNFNRTYPFNTVLRVGVVGEIDRETMSATVRVPRINTDVDVLNVLKLPYFRLVVVLAAVSDVCYDEAGKEYKPLVPEIHGVSETVTGQWVTAENILPEQIIEVALTDEDRQCLTEHVSLVLSMAIEFGKVGFTGMPQEIKNAGNGKVLKVW
jgi:hypothetical protein